MSLSVSSFSKLFRERRFLLPLRNVTDTIGVHFLWLFILWQNYPLKYVVSQRYTTTEKLAFWLWFWARGSKLKGMHAWVTWHWVYRVRAGRAFGSEVAFRHLGRTQTMESRIWVSPSPQKSVFKMIQFLSSLQTEFNWHHQIKIQLGQQIKPSNKYCIDTFNKTTIECCEFSIVCLGKHDEYGADGAKIS